MNVKELNGQDLDKAHEAADFLIKTLGLDHVDRRYVVLDVLRTELASEQRTRRELAKQK